MLFFMAYKSRKGIPTYFFPMNLLDKSIGKLVTISARDMIVTGILKAYDNHMNLSIDQAVFQDPNQKEKSQEMGFIIIRGATIFWFKPHKETLEEINEKIKKKQIASNFPKEEKKEKNDKPGKSSPRKPSKIQKNSP